MLMKLEKVSYIYGEGSGYQKQALKQVDLEIREGEFIGIVGHTGSGKSTLAKLLNGLEKPSAGSVFYRNQNIFEKGFSRRELRGKVGLVFQYPEHQLFETSVIKDVEFGPRNLGLKDLEIELRSYEALKQVGVGEELLDTSPFALSGGQKRRVAIAGILAMKPEILILDEPTAGLDPGGRKEILDLLRKLHQEDGITILLISHSMDDIARYADRVLVLNHGELVLDGSPEKIYEYEKELQTIGLGIPQATSVVHRLEEAGMPKTDTCLTPEAAAAAIVDWVQEKRGKKK